MGAIDLDIQGHLTISTHKPAKGCYTSQTGSCLSNKKCYFDIIIYDIHAVKLL